MVPGLGNVGGALSERASAKQVGSPLLAPQSMTYGEVITADLANAELRVQQLQRIQELLTKNPEFEELLTLVGRVGRY